MKDLNEKNYPWFDKSEYQIAARKKGMTLRERNRLISHYNKQQSKE